LATTAGSVGNVNDTFSVAITIVDDVGAFASAFVRFASRNAFTFAFVFACHSMATTLAFSALIGVAFAGRGVASIFLQASWRLVASGVDNGVGSSGEAGSGARESVSGSIMLSPHFQTKPKAYSLSWQDQRASLLLCLSMP